jgi:hypothetical protein
MRLPLSFAVSSPKAMSKFCMSSAYSIRFDARQRQMSDSQ